VGRQMRMFFVIPQQGEGSEDGAGLIVFDPHRWQGSDVQACGASFPKAPRIWVRRWLSRRLTSDSGSCLTLLRLRLGGILCPSHIAGNP
jgi:hypothetical protein